VVKTQRPSSLLLFLDSAAAVRIPYLTKLFAAIKHSILLRNRRSVNLFATTITLRFTDSSLSLSFFPLFSFFFFVFPVLLSALILSSSLLISLCHLFCTIPFLKLCAYNCFATFPVLIIICSSFPSKANRTCVVSGQTVFHLIDCPFRSGDCCLICVVSTWIVVPHLFPFSSIVFFSSYSPFWRFPFPCAYFTFSVDCSLD